jgi:hypothetical protein
VLVAIDVEAVAGKVDDQLIDPGAAEDLPDGALDLARADVLTIRVGDEPGVGLVG